MTTITANVSKMFEHIEPWDVSNSQANLGPNAGQLTWANALKIAARCDEWLVSSKADAVEGMREWARDTGAWDREEIAARPDSDCLAVFAQNIASELREHLGADDHDLHWCAQTYELTDWQTEACSPNGHYYCGPVLGSDVHVDYYTGC